MKYFYGFMCILGTLLPYGVFTPWLIENGLNINLLFSDALQNRIGAFAWVDVILSALVLLTFIWVEGRRKNMNRLWLPTLATLTVGVSLGLPLFLLMREIHMERSPS